MGTLREGVVGSGQYSQGSSGEVERGSEEAGAPGRAKAKPWKVKSYKKSWLEDCRLREGLGRGSRLNEGTNWVVPAQGHSPSSSASCTSRRPSSSQSFIFRAKGARAEVLGPRPEEHPTAQGKGKGAGGRRRARGVSGRASGTPQLEDSVS